MAIQYPQINSYQFLQMKGEPSPAGEIMEQISRKGKSGEYFRKVGRKNTTWAAMTCIDVLDRNAANALITTLNALRGTVVSVITASGGIFNTNICLGMSVRPLVPIGKSAGLFNDASTFLLYMDWQFQRLDVL